MNTIYTKKIITILGILLTSIASYAQVTQVKYYLTYNFTNQKYTVNMIAAQGNATSPIERQQGKARVGLTTLGNKISNITSLSPFIGNQNNNSTTPIEWNVVDSLAQPGIAYFALSPAPFQVSNYNNLTMGDTVAIFSFQTVTPDTCGNSVRLFNNISDLPTSSPNNVNAADRFKNTFAFGNNIEVYVGNQVANYQPYVATQPPYCVGDIVQLYAPANLPGAFVLSNSSLGTINANNQLTINATGNISISYFPTSGVCTFILPTIIANPNPDIVFPFNNICTGTSMQAMVIGISPPYVGTWTSSSLAVLGVNTEGIIKALSPGQATVTFTNANGCSSSASTTITVNQGPTVSLSGPSSICIGAITQFSPNTGGTWASTDPLVLQISNSGVGSGISTGSAFGIFTNTSNGCNSQVPDPIVVTPEPTLIYTGNTTICVGEATSISANSAGTWSANNPTVATISSQGIITGVSQGVTTFTFTNASNCSATTSIPVTVITSPMISTSPGGICIGGTKQFSANTFNGVWFSSNPSVATINTSGLATGLNSGTAMITFISGVSGCQSTPITISVSPKPIISGSQNSTCVNGSIILTANTLGTWSSNNTPIAVVNQNGVVTGQALGMAGIQITDNSGCISDPFIITITTNPAVSIIGSNQICVGTNTQVAAGNTVGTWSSSNPAVATIDNQGIVTGVSAGTVTFSFTPTAGGCNYTPSPPVTVFPTIVFTQGPTTLCLGLTTTFSPTLPGTWVSSNTQVIVVNPNTGAISTIGVGTAVLTYTSPQGCMANTQPITVAPRPVISLTGMDAICIGGTTQFTPSTGGTWESSNSAVATITLSGKVTGISSGTARFTFISNTSGCGSLPSPLITILPNPVGSIADSVLCIGASTLLSPSSSGSWAFSNPNVATTTPGGGVTTVGAGTAFFVFTNNNGCSSMPVKLRVRPNPTIIEPSFTSGCVNSLFSLTASPVSTWTSSNNLIATINANGNVNLLAPGNVKFKATATGGCFKESKEYTVNPNPIATITGTNSACKGETIIFTAGGGVSYLWTNGATTQAITSMSMNSGIWATTVTDINGCTASATRNFNVLQLPSINIVGQDAICPGEIVVWNATGGVSYAWSNNTIFPNLTLSPLSTTTLVVTVTDVNGCSATGSKILTVHPQPIINISSPSIKVGESANLTSNSAGTWISLNTSIASVVDNQRVTGNAEGTAQIKFTDAVTGCMDTLNVLVSKPTNTKDVELSRSIKVTPNPSSDNITILSTVSVNKVEIYSLRGQLLLSSKYHELDISNLPSSIYTVMIFTNHGIVNKKIIKL